MEILEDSKFPLTVYIFFSFFFLFYGQCLGAPARARAGGGRLK